jgi:dienelactone hydrolase
MPGTGEAPIVGSLDAERMFTAIFDWLDTQPEFDARRVAVYGGSFGGYWAVKVAHLYRDRIACAVNQGGGVHFDYDVEWNLKMEYGEYPFDPLETRAAAFGCATIDEWLDLSPKISLLRMGLLDQASAPMLLVNGVHDTITDPRDIQLLLEHGDPKTVRLYPTGHMGMTPTTLSTIATWVRKQMG